MRCNILVTLTAISLLKRSTADCSKNNTDNDNIKFSAQEGHFSSPGYPGYFRDTIQCTWYIFVANRHSVELELEFFDFGRSPLCSTKQGASFLEVRDGSDSSSAILGFFCGETKPEKISSSSREMLVRFKANGLRSTKFKANFRAIRDSPSTLLVVAGVSTIVGLMVVLLLLTLYLKRKRRNSDAENTSLSGSENQANQQDSTPCDTSGTTGETIDLQFSPVAGNMNARKQSTPEQELVNSCHMNERMRSQSLGALARENLAPVVE